MRQLHFLDRVFLEKQNQTRLNNESKIHWIEYIEVLLTSTFTTVLLFSIKKNKNVTVNITLAQLRTWQQHSNSVSEKNHL